MVHAKLPVLSLLCALLMLPPDLTLGKVHLTDAREQKALEFSIEQYNQDNQRSSGYLKTVSRPGVQAEVVNGVDYHITVTMVRTGCKKIAGEKKTYTEIQQCQQPLGNKQQITCHFKVSSRTPSNEMKLVVTDCEKEYIRKNTFCAGKGI